LDTTFPKLDKERGHEVLFNPVTRANHLFDEGTCLFDQTSSFGFRKDGKAAKHFNPLFNGCFSTTMFIDKQSHAETPGESDGLKLPRVQVGEVRLRTLRFDKLPADPDAFLNVPRPWPSYALDNKLLIDCPWNAYLTQSAVK
jgi:hypothetical protein